jgi:Immunoglobulin V-set domain.
VSTLTIENVTLEDGGNYTCKVIDHNKVTNKETKVIRVYGK